MTTKPPIARSSFVTGLSWFSIVLSCFTICVGVVQALVIFLAFKTEGLGLVMEEVARSGEMVEIPWFVDWAFANMRLLALLPLILGWIFLAVSIGLLRRKNWARIAFIVLLVVSTLATIAGTSSLWAGSSPFVLPGGDPYISGVTHLVQTMSVLVFCLNLATVALHAWIVWRLTRPLIRSEFGVETATYPG